MPQTGENRNNRKRGHGKYRKPKKSNNKCASCGSSISTGANGRPVSTNELMDSSNRLGSSVDPQKPPKKCYYGLINQGALCYLNAVLQTLFMTKKFRNAVERSKSGLFKDHLRKLFKMLKRESTHVGHELLSSLGITNIYEQQDAAEYFQKIVKLCSITKIYHGALRNSTKCLKNAYECGSESSFMILPLAVESHESYSVEDGLEEFFKPSILDGDNQLYCDKCEEKTDTEAVCKLVTCPEVLTLQLKRFYFDYNYMTYMKSDCTVEIPLQLQVTKFFKPSILDGDNQLYCDKCEEKTDTDAEFTYKLYAIIEHSGSVKSGHYYTIIKSFENGKWYRFDDSQVSEELRINDEKTIKSNYAYLLMYAKQNISVCRPGSGGKGPTQGAESDAEAGGRAAADRCAVPGTAGANLSAGRLKSDVTAGSAGVMQEDSVSGESCTVAVSKTVKRAGKGANTAQRKTGPCAAKNAGKRKSGR